MREFYATCAQGFEPFLAGELRSLGVKQVRPLTGSVAFAGALADAYRVCLWSRLASRVLMVIARVPASCAEELYDATSQIAWEEIMDVTQSFAIHARGVSPTLNHTQFTALKIKDALVDRFRIKRGVRPSVDTVHPDVRITAVLRGEKLALSLDLSGEPLHRRGYRADKIQTEAPLKETLASCVLAASRWYASCKDETPCVVIDPCCGSGTLVIEAASQALDRAPGLLRQVWGFESYLNHDEQAWSDLLAEADERCERAQNRSIFCIASDKDERALDQARNNARRAGVEKYIRFIHTDLSNLVGQKDLIPHEFADKTSAKLIVTNPPYAHRMGFDAQLPALYAAFSALIVRPDLKGAAASFITPDETLDDVLQRTPDTVVSVKNGPIESSIRVFFPQDECCEPCIDQIRKGSSVLQDDTHNLDNTGGCAASASGMISHEIPGQRKSAFLVPSSDQFYARLSKVYKQRKKWARKNGIFAYRIYDADLPDYAAAIDWYECVEGDQKEAYVHLAEYQAPKHIDQALAQRRLYDMLTIIPQICEVPLDHVVCKVRKRAKGGSQYRQDTPSSEVSKRSRFTTQEAGLSFLVDMGTYLDTGLFLDHRITRSLVRDLAKGTRFLNLFSYTGSATCYAAHGKARSTTTVDLSKTYLSWAQENMRLNGFTGKNHRFIADDTFGFLTGEKHRNNKYDLVFCDPPTFSNSRKMHATSFDVQRDHVDLLDKIAAVLSADGTIVFSCNLRSFKIDEAALNDRGLVVKNITAQTIPEDFSRNPRIHSCFLITHKTQFLEVFNDDNGRDF